MKNTNNLSDLMAEMVMNGASSDELRKMIDITADVIDFEKRYMEIPSHESFDKLVSMLYKDLTTAIRVGKDDAVTFNPYISDRTFEAIGKLSPYAEKWYNTLKHAHRLYDTCERIDDARATVEDLIPDKDVGINDCLRSKIGSFVHDYSRYMEEHYVRKTISFEKKKSDISADEYQEEAMRTASGMNYGYFDGITDGLLFNGLMGLCGESGECIDILKKSAFQGHDLDIEKLKEELGDVAWYLAVSARAVDCDLSDILRGNIEKLKKRYPDGFEAERSINREE